LFDPNRHPPIFSSDPQPIRHLLRGSVVSTDHPPVIRTLPLPASLGKKNFYFYNSSWSNNPTLII
jgi:hypothetical protein